MRTFLPRLVECNTCGGVTYKDTHQMCGDCYAFRAQLRSEIGMPEGTCHRCNKSGRVSPEGLCSDCFMLHVLRPLISRRDDLIRQLADVEKALVESAEHVSAQYETEANRVFKPRWVCLCGQLQPTVSYVEAIEHHARASGYGHYISREFDGKPSTIQRPNPRPRTAYRETTHVEEEDI